MKSSLFIRIFVYYFFDNPANFILLIFYVEFGPKIIKQFQIIAFCIIITRYYHFEFFSSIGGLYKLKTKQFMPLIPATIRFILVNFDIFNLHAYDTRLDCVDLL